MGLKSLKLPIFAGGGKMLENLQNLEPGGASGFRWGCWNG